MAEKMKLRRIRLNDILPFDDFKQPKRVFIDDIKLRGVTEPVHVYEVYSEGEGERAFLGYRVDAGRRRVMGSRIAIGELEREIEQTKKEYEETEDLGEKGILEMNVASYREQIQHLETINAVILDEHSAINVLKSNAMRSANEVSDMAALVEIVRDMAEEFGVNPERVPAVFKELPLDIVKRVREKTKVPAGTIKKRWKLTRLLPELLEGVKLGDITVPTGERIAVMDKREQRKYLDLYKEQGYVTARDLKESRQVAARTIAVTLFDGLPSVVK